MGLAQVIAQSTGQEPAGGAAIGEAIGATAGALVATALIAALVAGHRSGRLKLLDRIGAFAERQTGLPAWASLPSLVLGFSLLTAVLGMYWDISLHIDNGRDEGPLANPAHYLILIGLYGALIAGVLSIALAGKEKPTPTAIHLGADWWAPVGGLMMAACGAFALTGFPLDDMWHRVFGQDVTLWGPTHLMLIGGGSLAVLGGMVLMGEAVATVGKDPERQTKSTWRQTKSTWLFQIRRVLLVGGFLVALSTFQGEFDFGVPQFRHVFHPILIMFAASIGLVAARIYLGRGGALIAVLGFVAIRGLIAAMVGGVWDQTTPQFPLYLVEALIVEAVFARAGGRSPVANGVIAGALIGTVGLAAEWGWSHVWMPIPWESSLLPEALIAGLLTAICGGAVGGFVGGALTGRAGVLGESSRAGPRRIDAFVSREDGRRLERADRRIALAGGLVIMAVIGWALPLSADGPDRARVTLRDIDSGERRTVEATMRIEPAGAVDNPEFMNVTGWQGGGSVVDPLEEIGPGTYRTTEPIPVYGGWKSTLRIQQGDVLVSMPLFLPRDEAIPAKEVPAEARFTRAFQPDIEILQRERKHDVAGAVTIAAYLIVFFIAMALIAMLAWSLNRIDRGPGARRKDRPRAPRTRAIAH